jgi:hypothetical protein
MVRIQYPVLELANQMPVRIWIWPEPLVAPRVRRALGTRMHEALLAPRSNVKRMRKFTEMATKMSAKIIGVNTGKEKAFTIRQRLNL